MHQIWPSRALHMQPVTACVCALHIQMPDPSTIVNRSLGLHVHLEDSMHNAK